MKKSLMIAGLLIVVLGSSVSVLAADNYSSWTSVGIRKDFHKWKFELNEEFRFSDNVPTLERYFTELSAGYDVTNWLSIGAGYRFAQDRNKDNDWRTLHRFMADVKLSKGVKQIELSYRLRYTNEDDFVTGGNDASSFLRQKAEAEYHIRNSRWDPYLASELYYQLPKAKSGEFNKVRYTIGTKFAFNRKNRFNLFFHLQQEFNVSKPDRDFITGLSYLYRF